MKSFLKAAILSTIGTISTVHADMKSPATKPTDVQSNYSSHRAEMQKLRGDFEKRREEIRSKTFLADHRTNRDSKLAGSDDISQHEDKYFVYYDIKVVDKNSKIDTKIENGYITVTGSAEDASQTKEPHRTTASSSQSAFKKKFALPANVDADKMQMVYEEGKVVLKFPKINS